MTAPAIQERQAKIAIIGGGPAGLMAAEILSQHGHAVDVYDAMASCGRKFLLAGKGGMNITHSEPISSFITRYGEQQGQVKQWLEQFGSDDLRAWVKGLGLDTFVGSSGRVFPTDMKAAPLLRAWLQRLRAQGVRLHTRTRWLGWKDQSIVLEGPQGREVRSVDALVLALGGASWPRLGSDAAWFPILAAQGVGLSALQPSNCGFEIGWSAHFVERFAGEAMPTLAISYRAQDGELARKIGPAVITASGIEGTTIYAMSAGLREQIRASGSSTIWLDLLPDWSAQKLAQQLQSPRGTRSWASFLQSRLGLKGVKMGLLREVLPASVWQQEDALQVIAHTIKALPLCLSAPRPIAEAISSAGGVRLDALDQRLMLLAKPGVFCAGEMLDWEAPTGGYLLTACFASGRVAGQGVLRWLQESQTGKGTTEEN